MIRRLYPNSSSTNYKHSNNTHSYNHTNTNNNNFFNTTHFSSKQALESSNNTNQFTHPEPTVSSITTSNSTSTNQIQNPHSTKKPQTTPINTPNTPLSTPQNPSTTLGPQSTKLLTSSKRNTSKRNTRVQSLKFLFNLAFLTPSKRKLSVSSSKTKSFTTSSKTPKSETPNSETPKTKTAPKTGTPKTETSTTPTTSTTIPKTPKTPKTPKIPSAPSQSYQVHRSLFSKLVNSFGSSMPGVKVRFHAERKPDLPPELQKLKPQLDPEVEAQLALERKERLSKIPAHLTAGISEECVLDLIEAINIFQIEDQKKKQREAQRLKDLELEEIRIKNTPNEYQDRIRELINEESSDESDFDDETLNEYYDGYLQQDEASEYNKLISQNSNPFAAIEALSATEKPVDQFESTDDYCNYECCLSVYN
jgi:hypothetical protein